MDLVLFLATVKKISTTTVSVIRLVDYFAKNDPIHVKERLARSLELMSEYMREKHQSKAPGDAWRNDWFAENQVSNRRTAFRLLEKTIKEIINDSQENKSEHIAKFWVNICLTSNADIDEATAFSYLEAIEPLSWRQLCIIRLIALRENQEKQVDFRRISNEDVEQMPQDERTRFYSIGREYRSLMDDRHIEGASIPQFTETHEPFVDFPGSGWLPGYTKRLHSLMNLHEIQDRDIEKTFSIWNVRTEKIRRIRKKACENVHRNPFKQHPCVLTHPQSLQCMPILEKSSKSVDDPSSLDDA